MWKFSSSNESPPNILALPVPSPLTKSPPWIIKLGIYAAVSFPPPSFNRSPMCSHTTRWKVLPAYFPHLLSPVQNCLKFSVVAGTTSRNNSMCTRPTGCPPIEMSKYTTGLSGDLRASTVWPFSVKLPLSSCCAHVCESAGRAIGVESPVFFSLLPPQPIFVSLSSFSRKMLNNVALFVSKG